MSEQQPTTPAKPPYIFTFTKPYTLIHNYSYTAYHVVMTVCVPLITIALWRR